MEIVVCGKSTVLLQFQLTATTFEFNMLRRIVNSDDEWIWSIIAFDKSYNIDW